MRKFSIALIVVLICLSTPSWATKHPKHEVKVWLTKFRGFTFSVIQLPRCNHVEVIPTYEPAGETKEAAKKRLGGFAVCSGNFYDCKTNCPVDYFRRGGNVIKGREVGRFFLAIHPDRQIKLSHDYQWLKANPNINAVALGQVLKPFQLDGFSLEFQNQPKDRMGLGFTSAYIYIVQGKTDVWTFAAFFDKVLKCNEAINTDGGHVVRGKSPFHVVFRWFKKPAKIPSIKPKTAK